MYSNLTKKEKQRKLAQARKGAVQWSAQQLTRTNLRKTTSSKRLSTPTTLNQPTEVVDQLMDLSINTPIPLSENQTNTIQAIKSTLKDLQDQREAIETTIQVLSTRLQYLLNEENNPK